MPDLESGFSCPVHGELRKTGDTLRISLDKRETVYCLKCVCRIMLDELNQRIAPLIRKDTNAT